MIANVVLESRKTAVVESLAMRLLDTFNERGIQYCVWKGSHAIADGLAGDDDLDLLVAKQDFEAAANILAECQFKRADSTTGLRTPGIFHYYGYDETTKRFIHVHLYTRLLTGESLVQTHWLPLEDMLLEDRSLVDGVYVASGPSELAVFILRMMVKQGSLLELLWFGSRSREIHDKVRVLLDRADSQAAYARLKEHCAIVDAGLFDVCVRALRDQWSWFRKFVVGCRVRSRLRPYSRFGYFRRLGQYCRLTQSKLCRVVTGRRARKTLPEGAVVALVGGDATGKSTLVSDVHRWLSEVFVTRRIHVGKPPGGWLTTPLNLLLPAARLAFPRLRHSGSEKQSSRSLEGPATLLQAVRAVALAWDRNRLVRRAHRYAAAGTIVICDRYTSNCFGAMDSPRLQVSESPKGWKARMINVLARRERKLYHQNPRPEIVVKLTVSIETACQRNGQRSKADKHSNEELVSRHRSFRLWDVPGNRATVELDTEGHVQETVADARQAVWRAL